MESPEPTTQTERHARHREMLAEHKISKGIRHENHAKRRKARSVIPITLK